MQNTIHMWWFIYRHTKWSNAQHTKLQATCDILDELHTVNHDFVIRYGSRKEFLPFMTLIDRAFVLRFPQILQDDRRQGFSGPTAPMWSILEGSFELLISRQENLQYGKSATFQWWFGSRTLLSNSKLFSKLFRSTQYAKSHERYSVVRRLRHIRYNTA